jgi:exodeoxyribonuclease VII large subunit
MTLALFDEPPPGARTVSLVRLAGEIARNIGSIGRVAVEGEVHRPTESRSGAVWFTLRDRAAQVGVRVPRTAARRSRVVAGERVCVVGTLEWTPDRGQLALVAEEVAPVGEGAIAALIAATRERLAAEGVLSRPRRQLPLLPATVGVVCGSDAAVRKDIESVVASRFEGYPVRFQETTVSGPGAILGIVEALEAVVGYSGVDVVIVARGGGDATALLPWSSEEVCRAIAECPVPVVSAIGHDGDRPLCDEVADLRCATPSIAAAVAVPERAALMARLDTTRSRAAAAMAERSQVASRRLASLDATRAVRAGIEQAGGRLDRAAERLSWGHPRRQLAGCERRLRALDWRRPMAELLGRAAGRLESDERHLRALSPGRTLDRGYAVVTTTSGVVVRHATQVAPGDILRVRLASGQLRARVEEVGDG